jgi:G-patch domain
LAQSKLLIEFSSLTLFPSRSENVASNVTSRALPRLRSGTEQLKSEENGLTTFLKRCNARNLSVKARGTDTGKESPNKGKGSDYILTLEPIAEGSAKGDGSNGDTKVDDDKFLGRVNHDTNMMLQGTESLTREINVKSVDYEKIIDTDAVANSSLENTKHTIDEDVGTEPATNDTSSAKTIDIMAASVEPTNINPVVEPIKVEPTLVKPTDLKHAESQQTTEDATKINLADTEATIDQEQSHNDDLCDETNALEDLAAKTEEEVETNAWGKPVTPDPTRSKEGAIVGGKANPIGAENRGRAMMEKMGWRKGTGLGKQKGSILEPITHVAKNTKTGLYSSDDGKKYATALSSLPSENTSNSNSTSC